MEKLKYRGIWIFYLAIIGGAVLSIKLFREGNSYSGTGWIIITCCFISIVGIEKYLRHREIKLKRSLGTVSKSIDNSNKDYMESLNILISSKDPVKVHAIANLLRDNNIRFSVLDCNMSHMIPGVEIRIMVLGKDMEESIKLIESLGFDA